MVINRWPPANDVIHGSDEEIIQLLLDEGHIKWLFVLFLNLLKFNKSLLQLAAELFVILDHRGRGSAEFAFFQTLRLQAKDLLYPRVMCKRAMN